LNPDHRGRRAQFGKIVSLDYGNPELLDKYRKIYKVNQWQKRGGQADARDENL
jgi:hypothetical protein